MSLQLTPESGQSRARPRCSLPAPSCVKLGGPTALTGALPCAPARPLCTNRQQQFLDYGCKAEDNSHIHRSRRPSGSCRRLHGPPRSAAVSVHLKLLGRWRWLVLGADWLFICGALDLSLDRFEAQQQEDASAADILRVLLVCRPGVQPAVLRSDLVSLFDCQPEGAMVERLLARLGGRLGWREEVKSEEGWRVAREKEERRIGGKSSGALHASFPMPALSRMPAVRCLASGFLAIVSLQSG